MKLEKTIENRNGNILIRPCSQSEGREYYDGMPIIEALYLYDKNKSGCAIIFWTLRESDSRWIIEANEIGDRLTSTEFDEGVMREMFLWGRKISNIFLDFIIPISSEVKSLDSK